MIPNQNPMAVMPLANSAPWRTWIMNTTIQPPKATSMPTYPSKNRAQSQVTRAEGRVTSASRRLPCGPSASPCCRAMEAWYAAAVDDQKPATEVKISRPARPIYDQHIYFISTR